MFLIHYVTAQCDTRREIRETPAPYINRYKDTVSRWTAGGSYGIVNSIHNSGRHGNEEFLLWHRLMLRLLEQWMGLTIPRWDSQDDASQLGPFRVGNSSVWDVLGERTGTVSWQQRHNGGRPVTRRWSSRVSIPNRNTLNALLGERRFSRFSQRLEVYHGAVHVSY